MPAYWLGRSNVYDIARFSKYSEKVSAILKKWHGKMLAGFSRSKVLEGDVGYGRFFIIEFPSFEEALSCYNSQEYQEAMQLRLGGAGEVEVVIVDEVGREHAPDRQVG